jgi:two-component system, OmpR family, sensor histidine kinase KdpD
VKRVVRALRSSWVRGAIAAAGAPAAATLLASSFHGGDASAVSIYILAVVGATAVGGLWAGLAAAVFSFLGLNFFFTPPEHTFRVSKPEDLIALIVFLIVAAIVGGLLARALEGRNRAARREREARLLNYFASKLLSGEPLQRMLDDFANALLEPFSLARCEIHVRADDVTLDGSAERAGAAEGVSVSIPLLVGKAELGALVAVRRAGLEAPEGDDRALLDACAKQVAVAVERTRLDKQVEGARLEAETNQLRAAMFSSVTHDLRTPLVSIKAGVTTLLDEGVTLDADQRRELLGTILEETDRLNRLVGNILDLARVRAGALVPAKQLTDVDEVIESVLHRMKPTLSRVRVRTVVRPDLPEVPIDPVQIDQVLSNLLENAARFSPPGGEILLSAAPWRRSVRIRVADQGPGIPADERDRVFEPFFRRDAGEARMGSGLGLAIARAVVLAHGGRIWIEGAPSGGTAVVFELPVADAQPVRQEPSG